MRLVLGGAEKRIRRSEAHLKRSGCGGCLALYGMAGVTFAGVALFVAPPHHQTDLQLNVALSLVLGLVGWAWWLSASKAIVRVWLTESLVGTPPALRLTEDGYQIRRAEAFVGALLEADAQQEPPTSDSVLGGPVAPDEQTDVLSMLRR